MKKTIKTASLVLIMLMTALLPLARGPVSAKQQASPGSLIKGKTMPGVYYLGEDNKRYVFPNEKTYFSWYENFNNVVEVNNEDLFGLPLGGNVHYKPGVYLVKIQTDPKVYAVSEGGLLRWIKTEQLAKKLYGANWNLLIDDIPDSFFTNYKIGQSISDDDEFDPDEKEDQVPSISHDLGLKAQKKIARIIMHEQQRTCRRLVSSLEKIQKRLVKFGLTVPELGEDLIDQCAELNFEKKVAICHIPPDNPSAAKTIEVGKPAARAHLAHGDSLGECSDSEPSTSDTTPPQISAISKSASTSTATINWTTNEPSTSEVKYASSTLSGASTINSMIDSTTTTLHSIKLTGLSASTVYYFQVTSKDASNNTATSSEMTFTTEALPLPDTTAPIISGISTTLHATSTTISWLTDEPSSSEVKYATESLTSASSTSQVSASALVTSHSLDLTGLTASTTYYFLVKSADASSNAASSSETNFTTLGE